MNNEEIQKELSDLIVGAEMNNTKDANLNTKVNKWALNAFAKSKEIPFKFGNKQEDNSGAEKYYFPIKLASDTKKKDYKAEKNLVDYIVVIPKETIKEENVDF